MTSQTLTKFINHVFPGVGEGLHTFNHLCIDTRKGKLVAKGLVFQIIVAKANASLWMVHEMRIVLCHMINVGENCIKIFEELEHATWMLQGEVVLQQCLLL